MLSVIRIACGASIWQLLSDCAVETWWLDCSIKLSPEELDSAFQAMSHPALQAIRKFPNRGASVV